ncbi:MAG: dehydrogenase [Chitinophagaceae bacterium]|nr:MAG: dehydrogenase [Chitinophagaceae bacterium]
MPEIDYNIDEFDNEQLIKLYKAILKPRKIEEKMLILLRQGKVSKWFSGIGQEAIATASTLALEEDEYILPLHRNLGVFTARNVPLKKLFLQFQGKEDGFTKGRDRSFHFGTNQYHITGMISHLGPQLCVANGIALANKINKNPKVTLAYTGEGGTSEGDFHEALNIASVWDLPVIFVIENNGYGLSTPSIEQYKCKQLADRGIGYGMEAKTIDGNNILEVYKTIDAFAKDLRKNPRPVLIECMTFRMRGHEEASGVKYVPKELLEQWTKKDPVTNYENFLIKKNILSDELKKEIHDEIASEIDKNWKEAYSTPAIEKANTQKEINDLFKPFDYKEVKTSASNTKEMRFIDAVSDGLNEAMKKHKNLVLMGQDIAEYGGVFKITDGFLEKYGKDRVRNTPICESGIIGAGLGLSIMKMKSMIEMQFADFVSSGFNPIVNNLAKVHYRWGQNADVVIRMPTGAGVGAGPFHSQSNEAWFFHTPGLKILYPSNPEDAKGLLLSAFEDPNPVMYFEHKALYRSLSAKVPLGYYTTPIGKAKVVKSGSSISIITYGKGVSWALETVNQNNIEDVEIIDLRSLLPFDWEEIKKSVIKTGKAIILHEDTLTGGIGAEISALINEHLFTYLDGPVLRVGGLDTPVPFNNILEENFLPKKRFEKALLSLLAY